MDVIIYGISAWEYWRTPPALRDADIPLDTACSTGPGCLDLPRALVVPRANANPIDRIIRPRLLTDLKGLTFPIHVIPSNEFRHNSELIRSHRKHPLLDQRRCVDLGGGLWITDPALTLATARHASSAAELAYNMSEACGLYCRMPRSKRLSWVLNKMLEENSLDLHAPKRLGCNAYRDAHGHIASFTDTHGNPLPWTLATARNGTPTDLWKRPPLATRQDILSLAAQARGQRDSVAPYQAAAMCIEGSGSPFETKVALMLTCNVHQGGEDWERPLMNKVIPFSDEAQRLAGMPYCIGDMVWEEQRVCLECNGMAFHADREGFRLASSRSAALRSSGYTVLDISYEQFADLEKFDAMVNQFAETLGFSLKNRTTAFLKRREALHNQLVQL